MVSTRSNITIEAPMVTEFKTTGQIKTLLDSNFFTILIFLSILSSMLVLSLVISDVDGKTYEYGMLRALGFKMKYLMSMITINSSVFSFIGLSLGVVIAFLLNILLREIIFIEAENVTNYTLAPLAVAIGISYGFFMPLFANYYPVKLAMGKNLRDSLDLSKRTKDQFGVKIQKLEDIGMSFN